MILLRQEEALAGMLRRLRPHWRRDFRLPERIEGLIAGDRRRGARDRRLYREVIYAAVRHLPWVERWLDRDGPRALRIAAWLAPDAPATRAFRSALLAGWPEAPPDLAGRAAFLGEEASGLLPAWFRTECPALFEPAELEAQARRAPLWLRLQSGEAGPVLEELERTGYPLRRAEALGTALRAPAPLELEKTEAFRRGSIEVQDLGSQLVLAAAGIEPGGRWLDACAGAGGKTLQLAGLLGPAGSVEAHDVRAEALEELRRRAARAGARNIRLLAHAPSGPYDGVLVDAPCSGSGTWRRAPHLKWCTRPAAVQRSARRQLALLERFAPLVCPGGRLVYATCSLARTENEAVAAAFGRARPEFSPEPPKAALGFVPRGPGWLLLPSVHDTDGFFFAAMRRS